MRKTVLFDAYIGFLLSCICWMAPAPAEAMPPDFAPAESDARQIGIFVANDASQFTLGLLSNEDRYYSQGIHVFWTGRPRELDSAWQPVKAVGKALGASATGSVIRFGQDIFTPNDLRMTRPMVRDDRPFCGWTHLDLAQRFYLSQLNRPARLHIQLDVGVTGPASLAGDVQVWWHEKRRQTSSHPELDPDPSQGWSQQYANTGFPGRAQFALNHGLAFLTHRFSGNLGVDLSGEADLHAGMLYGNLGAATQIRMGLMTRSLYIPQLTGVQNSWEAFAFGRTKISAVGWNEVLTGVPGSEVHPSRILWQNEFGFVVRIPFPSLEISTSWSLWSRETTEQPQQPFQTGHIDYRPKLQERSAWFDHGFGTIRLTWLW